MKEKLFTALKQEYSNLGLGDEIIQGQAETLSATGLITNENLDTIVKGQKTFFSSLQSGIDKRVTSAVDKTKKEFEEKSKGIGAEPTKSEPQKDEKGEPEWFKAWKADQEKKILDLENENKEFKAERANLERQSLIANTAKELGIPEWRVKEGFVISADADETTIKSILAAIKQNIITAGLERSSGFPLDPDKKMTDKEIDGVLDIIGI